MAVFQKGNGSHSYIIKLFGIKIRFRNKAEIKNNKIVIVDENGNSTVVKSVNGLRVVFQGENATVKLFSPVAKFENTTIVCADNANVTIGSSRHRIINTSIHNISDGGSLVIGKNVSIRGADISIRDKSDLSVTIGDDCLIANNTRFWTTDFHTILDNEGRPLNEPDDIVVGNHCWICEETAITKGSRIANDTIVAFRSVVTDKFDKPNTIIGGIPAKIISDKNTTWSSDSYEKYLLG